MMNDRFKELFFKIKMYASAPALVGSLFSAEQFADLADEILVQAHKMFEGGKDEDGKRYIKWYYYHVKCRKESKYYSKILDELNKELKEGCVILNNKKYKL
jgi:hypothetical protein